MRPRKAHRHQDGGRAGRETVIFASVCGLYDKSMTTLLMLDGGGMPVLQLLGWGRVVSLNCHLGALEFSLFLSTLAKRY